MTTAQWSTIQFVLSYCFSLTHLFVVVCATTNAQVCTFPFKWGGRTYNDCARNGNTDQFICATKVGADGTMIYAATCAQDLCKMNSGTFRNQWVNSTNDGGGGSWALYKPRSNLHLMLRVSPVECIAHAVFFCSSSQIASPPPDKIASSPVSLMAATRTESARLAPDMPFATRTVHSSNHDIRVFLFL